MNEHENIDRLFQESFKDFEVDAPKGAWKNIEKKLAQDKRKAIIPIWQKITAAAAVVAVLILAGSQWLITPESNNSVVVAPDEVNDETNNPNTPSNNNLIDFETQTSNSNPVVTTNENESYTEQPNETSTVASGASFLSSDQVLKNNGSNNSASSSSQIAAVSNENNAAIASTSKQNTGIDAKVFSDLSYAFMSKAPVSFQKSDLRAKEINSKQYKFQKPKQKSLVEVAAEINSKKTSSKTKGEKSWFVKPNVSPIFYGNLGSGSAVDQNFNQNTGQGEVNMSYGLNVAYKVNDKLKVRTGINRVNLNYNTDDVFLVSSAGFSSFDNVDVASSFSSSVLTGNQLETLENSDFSGRLQIDESQLQQQLGFIEIPMEVEYKIIDKTIDVNIIGGASTLLLNDNNLDIQAGNNSIFLGEASNVNSLSFSTNFAIGLDYDISDRLILNLEPTFKYQFNTFQSGTTDFQPYFMGIYSGVIFKF